MVKRKPPEAWAQLGDASVVLYCLRFFFFGLEGVPGYPYILGGQVTRKSSLIQVKEFYLNTILKVSLCTN